MSVDQNAHLLSRRRAAPLIASGLAALAAACNGSGSPGLRATAPAPEAAPAQPPKGVPIALILPLTGNGAAAGTSLRNSAEFALSQFKEPGVRLIVKDDKGSPEGARLAAQEALAEGAELLLGPLFGPAVQEAGALARQAGKPMIAFSTDASVASRGVYLLSFMPEGEVERVVDHAGQKGRKAFAALVPDTSYGRVVEGQFQQTVARRGGTLVALERLPADPAARQAAVAKVAALVGGDKPQADALFLPDTAEGLNATMPLLLQAGYNPARVTPLGTGLWNDPAVFKIPGLQGGLFAAPESAGFDRFAARYQERFGAPPARIATLSYDAISLAVALVRTQGSQRFSEGVLTAASGFSGEDGAFRFRQNGTNERSLAVLEVRGGGVGVASPAPKSFGGGAAGT